MMTKRRLPADSFVCQVYNSLWRESRNGEQDQGCA